jgi:hypothetical protein
VDCVCATFRSLIRSLSGADNARCRSQTVLAAAGVSGLGVIMRPTALRIIFGLLLGVLAAFFIGALAPPTPPTTAMEQSSAFALRFSSALPGRINSR